MKDNILRRGPMYQDMADHLFHLADKNQLINDVDDEQLKKYAFDKWKSYNHEYELSFYNFKLPNHMHIVMDDFFCFYHGLQLPFDQISLINHMILKIAWTHSLTPYWHIIDLCDDLNIDSDKLFGILAALINKKVIGFHIRHEWNYLRDFEVIFLPSHERPLSKNMSQSSNTRMEI